ncbi:hypothetical protein LOTGIDRAFT_114339, partial [Lottia gigantea]
QINMEPLFISPLGLEKILETETALVQLVDCRSFIHFNRSRILTSVNVFCTPLVKKRNPRCLPLDVIMSKEAKCCLSRPNLTTVILYDQDSDQLTASNGSTDLNLMYKSMVRYFGNKKILILTGGFTRFKQECPDLCTPHPSPLGTYLTLLIMNDVGSGFSKASFTPLLFYFQTQPVELMPYLFLGDALHSTMKDQLLDLGITAILNVSTSCANHFPQDFRYKIIPVEDTASADLHFWFKDAIQFIEEEKKDGGKILVHCKGGVSRSATVCLAYIMYTRCVGLEDAFDFIKSRRDSISPNANFMMQLYDYEKLVVSHSSSSPLSPCRLYNPVLSSSSDSNSSSRESSDDNENGSDIELSSVPALRIMGKKCVST